MPAPLVIGSNQDPHVRAVVAATHGRASVVDVETLPQSKFVFHPPDMRLEIDGRMRTLSRGTHGWIRRLSPIAWEAGTVIGSHEAVEKASWLALLAYLLRHDHIDWLTSLDPLVAAENKLTQYANAVRLSLPIPTTMVSNDIRDVEAMKHPLVAKPLGPGHFSDGNGWLSVFTDDFDITREDDARLLDGPPFIIQQRIEAVAHLRVVTVRDHTWIYRLDARGLPTDWRQQRASHSAWRSWRADDLGTMALRLADQHTIGYSSQDWIETSDGYVFLDLNPSGQWLFLPSPGAEQTSSAIAAWLLTS